MRVQRIVECIRESITYLNVYRNLSIFGQILDGSVCVYLHSHFDSYVRVRIWKFSYFRTAVGPSFIAPRVVVYMYGSTSGRRSQR